VVQADEPLPTTSNNKRDWWNDPLGVFKPDAKPTALKVHGFIIGTFLGPLGVFAIATFSSAEKRGHRLFGTIPGLALWLPLWIVVSGG
jgi:hypothetical protein